MLSGAKTSAFQILAEVLLSRLRSTSLRVFRSSSSCAGTGTGVCASEGVVMAMASALRLSLPATTPLGFTSSVSRTCSFRGTQLRNTIHTRSFRHGRRTLLGCRAALAVDREPPSEGDWRFDPLGLEIDGGASGLSWNAIQSALMMSRSGSGSSSRGAAAAMEDKNVDFGDFFKGKLPEKFLVLLGWLVLSRLGTYVPLWGVDRSAFQGSIDSNSLLGTLDTFSGGSIGRLGLASLGIVPFINAQIVAQLLGTVFPKLQDLQKKEGEAGRKKVLQWTKYASVAFGVIQAVGQVSYIRPYVTDFSPEWAVSAVAALTLGAVLTMLIGEKISDLKLGNGTSLLIFTNIVSYLPSSIGRTVAQAVTEGNYPGLAGSIGGFLLLVLGIVYVQEAERKIPINYASRFKASSKGLGKSAYLPFKVNSSGVMPIIFSSSLLALPASAAKLTGLAFLKDAAVAFYPNGSLYLPANVLLIAFFNYFYTFLQLDPKDVSDQLKRQGASIPSVRPGKATAAFIETVLGRISVLGSAFLGVMALAPFLVEGVTHLPTFRGFAGTSVLILVGSATDTARKVQAELVSQKYKTIEFYDVDNLYGPK